MEANVEIKIVSEASKEPWVRRNQSFSYGELRDFVAELEAAGVKDDHDVYVHTYKPRERVVGEAVRYQLTAHYEEER